MNIHQLLLGAGPLVGVLIGSASLEQLLADQARGIKAALAAYVLGLHS